MVIMKKQQLFSVIMFLFSVLSAIVYVYTNMKEKMNGRRKWLELYNRNSPCPIAHRGCMEAGPENSHTAFEAAVTLGAGGVEIDVRKTRDGKLVVFSRCRRQASYNGMAGAVL